MYVCVWGRRSSEKRGKKEKWKWKEKRKERIKKQERTENINLFIQINKQTDRRKDRRTGRQKSFTGMRYNTEQYGKQNSIKEKRKESNRIKSNQIDLK